MKASDFLRSRGRPAPSHPVTVRLVDNSGESQSVAEAQAVMRFVADRDHAAALDAASKALASAKDPPTDESRTARQQAHLLHAILRDAAEPATPFFDSPEEAHALLVPSERLRLLAEWQSWVEREFPDVLTPDEFKELAEDARTLFFGDLLTKHGYWPIRRALTSLALHYGKSLT